MAPAGLRFRPGAGPADPFGRSWEFEGDPRALDLDISDDELRYGDYPDALERLWGCLRTPRCGDLVLSAEPGYTFGELSGGYHKASDHGSLHAEDSHVFVLAGGFGEGERAPRRITDVAPMLLDHFGAGAPRSGVSSRQDGQAAGEQGGCSPAPGGRSGASRGSTWPC